MFQPASKKGVSRMSRRWIGVGWEVNGSRQGTEAAPHGCGGGGEECDTVLSNARSLSLPSFSLCGLRVINKMSEKVSSNARKRNKLKCLVHGCNQTFDDDYRTSHNIKYHKDLLSKKKSIPYETYGAPKNPFSMAARYKQNPNDTADASTNAIKHDQVW